MTSQRAGAGPRFPEGFLWGAATAAHQVEGGNWNSDWWEYENRPGTAVREPSGDACDHWHRYEEDLDLLAALGFNAYRFSLEWARVEPEEAMFSRAALDHYRRVCAACRERGLTPVVTFHHFTNPRWLARRGGWEEPGTVDLFGRYVGRAAAALGDLIGWACTINEPSMIATHGYLTGGMPPNKRDRALRRRVNDVLVSAHRRAVDAIRASAGAASGPPPVGICLALNAYEAAEGGEDKLEQIRGVMEDVFFDGTAGDDFVGVQSYTRTRVGPDGVLPPEPGVERTQMGYEFWPEALEAVVRRSYQRSGGVPVLVTENGISTADDTRRVAFAERALRGLGRAVADGVPVRGYLHWSLLDNFEWGLGYGPTFGLVAVDRETFERRPKPSAAWLGSVARANGLP